MEKEKIIKDFYTKILNICKEYKQYEYDELKDMRNILEKSNNHLMLIEWKEKYWLDISHEYMFYGYSYIKLSNDTIFSYFANAKEEQKKWSGKFINWEDKGKQPKNEWLYQLSFPTWSYIFWSDYTEDLFERFWNELKTYWPKYCDSHNNHMYFSLDNAKWIYNDYRSIYLKYRDIYFQEKKQRDIHDMERKLEEMKKTTT